MTAPTTSAKAKSTVASAARSVVRGLLRVLPARLLALVVEESVASLHRTGDKFLSLRVRRKSGDAPAYYPIDPIAAPATVHPAILLQGPLLTADDFTLETVRYYRKCAPKSIVIVSTWHGESEAVLQRIRALGADVVLSDKPSTAGRMNVNYQVASTYRGLQRAGDLDCSYVAKTRTDQRLYAVHALAGFVEMLRAFPVIWKDRPRERIVALSRWTSKFCPLFLADMFMFGRVDDLLEYWSPGIDTMSLTAAEYNQKAGSLDDLHEYAECSPEHFLVQRYLERIGAPTDFTLKNWWTLLAERFLVVDAAMLDLYWPKYRANDEAPEMTLEGQRVGTVLRFLDWLRLYQLRAAGRELTDFDIPGSPQTRLPLELSAPT